MLANIVETCHSLLSDYPAAQEAQDYLNGRLSKSSQDMFQFGYFPDVANLSALSDVVGEEILLQQKLLYTRHIEDVQCHRQVISSYFEQHPLVMPFCDPYGQPVGLVGRTLLSEPERLKKKIGKYKNTQDSPIFKKGNLLFGLYENKRHILEKEFVYVVEGQFDVIKAAEIGLRNVVALGSSSMTNYQYSVISRYVNTLFLLLDNDVAGNKGRKRIINKFGSFINIRNLYIPEPYKDIDEYITAGRIGSAGELSLVVKD